MGKSINSAYGERFMKSLDIYKLIKETLSENSINNVTSYKTSDQKYP